MTPRYNKYKPYQIVDPETGRVIDSFYHIMVAKEWLSKYKKTLMTHLEIKKVKEDEQ